MQRPVATAPNASRAPAFAAPAFSAAFLGARSPPRRPRGVRWNVARARRRWASVSASSAAPAGRGSPDSPILLPKIERRASAAAAAAAAARPPAPRGRTLLRLLRLTRDLSKDEPFIAVRLVLALLCVLLSKVVALGVPFLLKNAVDLLSVSLGGRVTPRAGRLAVLSLVLHGAAKVLASASHELRNGVFAKAGQRLGRRLTLAAFHNLLSLDAEFFSASRTGALTRIVDRGTRSVLTLFRTVVLAFLPTLFEVVLVCGVLLSRFELRYVLVLLATFAAYMWWTVFMSAVLGRLRAEMNLVDNATASKATDSLYNYETVALFDARDLEVARLDVSLREYEGLATENEWQYALQNVLQTAVYTCGLTAILVIGALGVVAGGATVGDLVMMSSLLAQLWVPCQYFGWQYREATQAAVDVGNLFSVLEEASSVVDNRDRDLHVSRGEVSFENVSFTYPSRGSEAGDGDDDDGEEDDRTVLNDISFTVPAGKTVALCGASGGGKSSVLRLLSRIYDVSSGRICVDGQNIADVSLSSLRRNISVVPQSTVIWNETASFNILYGRPNATQREVVAAAKAAALHDTIVRMPQGYDTVLGEKGVRMSGGEAQRMSAARALLKGSRILLQDEATASLDTRTEAEVTKSLNAVQGLTRLVVAHRLSTIFDADQILVLRSGRIIERGTHGELLSIQGGAYADMWLRQSQTGDVGAGSGGD